MLCSTLHHGALIDFDKYNIFFYYDSDMILSVQCCINCWVHTSNIPFGAAMFYISISLSMFHTLHSIWSWIWNIMTSACVYAHQTWLIYCYILIEIELNQNIDDNDVARANKREWEGELESVSNCLSGNLVLVSTPYQCARRFQFIKHIFFFYFETLTGEKRSAVHVYTITNKKYNVKQQNHSQYIYLICFRLDDL